MDLSIVTPSFQSRRWIELCVQSVRHACRGLEYEHIVCDGGSTDGTLEFLTAQRDVRLISGPDRGMYDALNRGMAAARGRIVGHLNTDEQYERAGLRAALTRLEQSGREAVFGPTVMLDGNLEFLYLFQQITVPRPVDADWQMPVQTCSLLFRRSAWEACPYPSEYRVVGDHVWFRRQMARGISLAAVRRPIGIFTWHGEDLGRRLGEHGEAALKDVDRRGMQIRLAKWVFRWRKFFRGGFFPPPSLYYEIMMPNGYAEIRRISWPALRVSRRKMREVRGSKD